MTFDELISSCKSGCAFSTADALPPSQSKLHPPEKKMKEKRFDIFKSTHKKKKTSALPNHWLALKAVEITTCTRVFLIIGLV